MITIRNVNEALPVLLNFFRHADQVREISPRGSRTYELRLMPFVTHYRRPLECVLFNPLRNANPFFHFFEDFSNRGFCYILFGSCNCEFEKWVSLVWKLKSLTRLRWMTVANISMCL